MDVNIFNLTFNLLSLRKLQSPTKVYMPSYLYFMSSLAFRSDVLLLFFESLLTTLPLLFEIQDISIFWYVRYQDWGQSAPHRPVEDNAFAVARFFQLGGSFHNYYMVGHNKENLDAF